MEEGEARAPVTVNPRLEREEVPKGGLRPGRPGKAWKEGVYGLSFVYEPMALDQCVLLPQPSSLPHLFRVGMGSSITPWTLAWVPAWGTALWAE